jgi:RHS repeat-associated protein
MDSDFQYAGYYTHQRSGLSLTRRRAYSPALGRWINRDPIGERGGVNLFNYVASNPISNIDPSGTLLVGSLTFIDSGGGGKSCSKDTNSGGGGDPTPNNPNPDDGDPGDDPPGPNPPGPSDTESTEQNDQEDEDDWKRRNPRNPKKPTERIEPENKTPKGNQRQNRQFKDAIREIERKINRTLSRNEINRIHRGISKSGSGYHDIVDFGIDEVGGR